MELLCYYCRYYCGHYFFIPTANTTSTRDELGYKIGIGENRVFRYDISNKKETKFILPVHFKDDLCDMPCVDEWEYHSCIDIRSSRS